MKDTIVAWSSGKTKTMLLPSTYDRITFLQKPMYIQEDENTIQPNHEGSSATVVCIALA